VFLLSPGFGRGGAERQMAVMAHHWAGEGRRVTLATWTGPDQSDGYPLPAAVGRLHLMPTGAQRTDKIGSMTRWVRSFARLVMALRSSRAGVVVSFSEVSNILAVAAGKVVRRPVVISIRSNPARILQMNPRWTFGVRAAYRRASEIVVQTAAVADWCRSFVQRDAIVVPNVLRDLPAPPPFGERLREIVCVANLTDHKGQDVLIRAFASVDEAGRAGWTLRLIGEGPARERLEALVVELGLQEVVSLPGSSDAVVSELRKASIFVLASRFEGFPNALQEAMGMGLACVSTDCDFGPRDLIEQGESGVLVPVDDAAAMAKALSALIQDRDLRQRLGQAALRVREIYAASVIMPMWERAMASALAKVRF
jgi:GalNAc-alpha-(1->4)-GalNAc-alpha-(1->3)-diNAcBac-PP-undecaprenol alpha-1,4-N-acetyl-D-galactosaminyltransferase